MTGEDESSKDRELRALLQKIAATAGDPPEHGLARLATMRRRRTRHRRGAVATTMALAVAGVGGVVWLTGDDRDQQVAVEAVEDAVANQPRTELPDVLAVSCSHEGIDVPVASIRPQEDGLHIEVENGASQAVDFRVASAAGWRSGDLSIEPGTSEEVRQPVPPGVLTVSCQLPGGEERRRVELVDVDGLYTEPELDCVPDDRNDDQRFPLVPPASSWVEAVRRGLGDYIGGEAASEFQIKPLDGYPAQRFSDPAEQPMARVARDDETMALVSLVTPDEGATWTSIVLLDVCTELLESDGSSSADDGPDAGTDEGSVPPDS